ncbi:oxygen-independent coproporphyrinogen III oxidase [Sphingomonas sp. 28-62-11]|uniref:oxygen-independent coproporphyrinogen III oxidase n=1 Tax=Sphingomonas sp. 28-62-11 TaxID=1970432 RepID=UPI000BD18273|nr:MAG: oxygen-independent coproporphyrinogen III oxidase [Sphingomonas sp. 28-62-11]
MWPYYSDLLATPVPRYTSFPTAAEFQDSVGPPEMAQALATVGEDQAISLYLHIPYCGELCWYCGCNTGAANRTSRVQAYLLRLIEEIELVGKALGGRGRVQRIAWGGGSPNALAPEDFDTLMQRLKRVFHLDDPVVSVEIDPRGFDGGWADALRRNRVTRVSLGVQTFDDGIQAAIGRVQPTAMIAESVKLLRGAGVSSINFDLMYGLPFQTVDKLAATIDTALAMHPDRLAVFGYAHVPHLIARQRQIDDSALPDSLARFAQAEFAYERLTRDGYAPVGFDHFALPGDALAVATTSGRLRRNFQGFTEDSADILIGLGASAISQFPGWLIQNEKNAGRYHLRVANGQFAAARGWKRSIADQCIGRAIEQLLCQGYADLSNIPHRGETKARLAHYVRAGLAEWQDGRLVINQAGLPYVRTIAAALDPYRQDSSTRFSSAI